MENAENNIKKIIATPKFAIVAVLAVAGLLVIVGFISKYSKRRKADKEREKLLKETINPNSAGSKAVQLEALIFARKTLLYGWEPDKEGILRFFADYNKADVDKVLQAYAILYPKQAKGFSVLNALVPASALVDTSKEYKGSAFADLENVSDKQTFDLVNYAYQQLK